MSSGYEVERLLVKAFHIFLYHGEAEKKACIKLQTVDLNRTR